MTKPTPSSNRTLIEINVANIANLKENTNFIREQVTNHIPASIKSLDDKVDLLAIKLAGLVAITTFIAQYFLNK